MKIHFALYSLACMIKSTPHFYDSVLCEDYMQVRITHYVLHIS